MKIYNYFQNMAAENISLGFRLKNVDETRNYLIEEINQMNGGFKSTKKFKSLKL